jgi:NADH-quinone oxidoreductase subunit L
MTFWGRERFDVAQIDNLRSDDADAQPEAQVKNLRHTPHESPLSMTIPLIVLALLSTFGGLVGVPYALSSMTGGHPENYFERTLEPVLSEVAGESANSDENSTQVRWLSPPPQPVDGKPAFEVGSEKHAGAALPSPEEITQERLFTLISVLIALTGISIGWFMFKNQPLRRMPRLFEEKYKIDELYDATIIQPILVVSREGLWKIFDMGVIDGAIHGLGRTMINLGKTVRYMQVGFVRVYAAILLAGAVIIVAYFAYNGAHVLQLLTR